MIPGGWERNSFYESFLVPKHTLTSAFETPTAAAQPSHFWKPLEEFWLLSLACLVGAQHSYMPQSLSFSCKRWKGALLPQRTPRWRGCRRRGDDYVCSSEAAKATTLGPTHLPSSVKLNEAVVISEPLLICRVVQCSSCPRSQKQLSRDWISIKVERRGKKKNFLIFDANPAFASSWPAAMTMAWGWGQILQRLRQQLAASGNYKY